MLSPDSQLTPHFKLREFFTHNGGFDQESWDYLNSRPDNLKATLFANLNALAKELEHLRVAWGASVHITSGYRCPLVNQAVGGAPPTKDGKGSYHMRGMAADIVVAGIPPVRIQSYLKDWKGGLGSYRTFTHIDIGPKRRWHG